MFESFKSFIAEFVDGEKHPDQFAEDDYRLAAAAMLLALVGNLYPVPEGPYGKLPYIYLAYLIAGLAWFFWRARHQKPPLLETS